MAGEYWGSGSPTECCIPTRFSSCVRILGLSLSLRLRSTARCKALVEVMNDVVDMLEAYREPDHVFRHAGVDAFLFG